MRRLLLLASAVVFVDTAFYAAITPLLPHYVDTLHISKTAAGILAATYPAGTFLGSLPGGYLAARFGVRQTTLLGLAIMTTASVAFAFGTSIVVLDVARFIQGIGGAMTWAGAFGWLIGSAPAHVMAPPTPWMKRATSNTTTDVPNANATEAADMIARPIRVVVRTPARAAR